MIGSVSGKEIVVDTVARIAGAAEQCNRHGANDQVNDQPDDDVDAITICTVALQTNGSEIRRKFGKKYLRIVHFFRRR